MPSLPDIIPGHDLDADAIRQAINGLLDPGVSEDTKAQFLVQLRAKGES